MSDATDLGPVLPDDHPPGGGALDLPARQGRRRHRARQEHPRHRLQRLAGRPAALPRRRLPHLPLARRRAARSRRTASARIHAEINAIAQAAKNGAAIRDADIYITHTPCIHCFKVLINTGIKRIFYEKQYKLHTIEELLGYTDVTLEQIPPVEES